LGKYPCQSPSFPKVVINSFQTQVLDRKKFGKDIYQIAFRKAIQSS